MTDATPTPSTLARSFSAHPFESTLSEQLSYENEQANFPLFSSLGPQMSDSLSSGLRISPKSRSLSDAAKHEPANTSTASTNSSQPASGDLNRLPSKDDSSMPTTPQRAAFHRHGLSLNLPSKISGPLSPASRGPLSPQLDSAQIYGSPASVLPRRSRGLDFSRACTNLHHSTLAESSPESSPTIGGRGVNIPYRRVSPGSTSVPPLATSGPADRATVSSSVSSVNMIESDTSSSDEDDEPMIADRDDMIITNTPQATKMGGSWNPFSVGNVPSPGTDWMGNYSQAAASLLSFRRARFRKSGRSRHSSSSTSGNSSKPSPRPLSPPVLKSIENSNGGYFNAKNVAQSRRESLSLGTRDLHLSDLSDDGDTQVMRSQSPAGTVNSEGGPLGVIRRAVTRRGSLLPKTKTFARIRAALVEEASPIDSEVKLEAEVIRQVRESEPSDPKKPASIITAFLPLNPPEASKSLDEKLAVKMDGSSSSENNLGRQAMRNHTGSQFCDSFNDRYRTPPPSLGHTGPSSASEKDTLMDATSFTVFEANFGDFPRPWERPHSRPSTPHIANAISNGEISRKRRRQDDLDPNVFKRRAVSPSVSIQSSPVLAHSTTVKDSPASSSALPVKPALGAPFSERPNNDNGNRNGAGTLKRVGLQGMNETSDGFMNMSIE